MSRSIHFLCLLLLLSSWGCLGLNIEWVSHLQDLQDQQAYLDSLIQLQTNLKSKIDELEQLSSAINRNVSLLEQYPSTLSSVLQSGLSLQRTVIYDASSSLIFPLNKKKWDCSLLTQAETKAITQQISQSQKNVALLKERIAKEEPCQRNAEISNQIEYLNLYIDRLAKQVDSNCANATKPQTVLVPNSQNQNFVYGVEGEDRYNEKIQELLDEGYTKLECPIQTPFPKDNACVGCPKDKIHYFDLSQSVCLTCPDSYVFDVVSHKCAQKTMNSNPDADNYEGSMPNPQEGVETCPIGSPFFNGTHCVNCQEPAFFDFGSHQCKECPSNTTFDVKAHLCVYKKFNSNIDANTENYCCGDPSPEEDLETCPSATPFFNGKGCIACKSPAFFNLGTLACELCPEGQLFSIKQKKCLDKKYVEPTFTSVVPSQGNYIGDVPKPDPLYENVQKCPESTPFWDGRQCLSCQLPKFWSFQDSKCQVCPGGKGFNIQSKSCVELSTKKMNNNMITLTNFVGDIPDFDSKLATCPEQTPFFNGEECIVCSLPKYANLTSLQCESCKGGFKFEPSSRQCLVESPSAATDLSADNIFYTGNWTELVEQTQRQNLPDCPNERPFFNGQTDSCIACTQEYPLFDIRFNRCITCSGSSQFSQQRRVCVLGGRVSATVERMIMNTVGWA